MRFRFSLLFFALAGLVMTFAPLPVQPTAPQARTFRIDARQFAYSPSELRVNPGDTVTIQLVSTDVVHGLYVDGYDVSVKLTLVKAQLYLLSPTNQVPSAPL
jgi:hypothetical protein